MFPYGNKRTLGNCSTSRFRRGGKIHIKQDVKSRKYGRKWGNDENMV